jgi:hypothetical protein
MSRIPAACTHCGRTFSSDSRDARLAHLEFDQALCDRCVWLVEHPESAEQHHREHRAAA